MAGEANMDGVLDSKKLLISDEGGVARAVIGSFDMDGRPVESGIHVTDAMITAGLDAYQDCLQYTELMGAVEIKAIFCSMVRGSQG